MVGALLLLSALGVLLLKKPVHACLSFLLTLFCLADLYLQLSAEFIAVMQVLVYAGAILVIFMFVIILFQDAYSQIEMNEPQCSPLLLSTAALALTTSLFYVARQFAPLTPQPPPEGFGTVEKLGHALYVDYFFPFEAVILIFLMAIVGALYTGRRAI